MKQPMGTETISPIIEDTIRRRIKWQEQHLAEVRKDSERGPIAEQRTQGYISALKWVLEICEKGT